MDCLAGYQPFSFTKTLVNYHDSVLARGAYSWGEVAKKVAIIAGTVLLLPFTFLLDLLLLVPTLIYRNCCVSSEPALIHHLPEQLFYLDPLPAAVAARPRREPRVEPEAPAGPPVVVAAEPAVPVGPPVVVAAEPAVPVGPALLNPRNLERWDIDAALAAGQESGPHIHFNSPTLQEVFFRHSIDSVFLSLPWATRDRYRQLLENRGFDNRGEPGDIEIFQWVAGCSLIYYVIHAARHGSSPAPTFLRGYLRVRQPQQPKTLENIIMDFRTLDRNQQAALALQIRNPEVQWDLSEDARSLRRDIQALSVLLTQNREFTGFIGREFPEPRHD